MIIMFNKYCTLREIPITERVLRQIDYDNDELTIVTYLLLSHYSNIFNGHRAKTVYVSCELLLANMLDDSNVSRKVRDKMVKSLKTLEKKELIKIVGNDSISWNSILKIDIENLLPNENEVLFTIVLDDLFKLYQLKIAEFRTCLQLYAVIKSHVDNDYMFSKCATMLSQVRITNTRFYGDGRNEEWIARATCKKYLSKLYALGIFSEIDATPSDLNFNLSYVYCRQEDVEKVMQNLGEVVDNLEVVKQARGKERKDSWSWKVRERDNHKCVLCGEEKGVMHAHHLNAKKSFPEQALALDNGVTLCQKCHHDFHGEYGVGYNTKEQFEEFKKLRSKL